MTKSSSVACSVAKVSKPKLRVRVSSAASRPRRCLSLGSCYRT